MLLAEAALVSSTLYLGYVTQFPYHVRRRHAQHVRTYWVAVRVRCRHGWHWVCWQVTAVMPGRVRNEFEEE